MFAGNPVYTTLPETPPGLAAIPYLASDVVASMTGGVAAPYVPANQSTYDAWAAKRTGNQYKDFLRSQYGQFGYQAMNTVGGMEFMQSLAPMVGTTPDQMRRDLNGGGRAFGRSLPGSFVVPLADAGLNALGVTGGSLVATANEAFAGRMNLLTQGEPLSPYNVGQQHQAMAAAGAAMSMVNGLLSRQGDNGRPTLLPNTAVTQGFDRERLQRLFTLQAGAGMYTDNGKGYADQMQAAAGDVSLGSLDYTAGDFTGGGADSNLGKDAAAQVKALTQKYANRMKAGIEAMGALRDMIKEVDGLEEKLTDLTNGDWLRSGANATRTRDAVRELNAVTQMYNLDPKETLDRLVRGRNALQASAGITDSMKAVGITGGGMFGLPAQTEMLATVEDMITARGVRGDPVKENALKMQGVQAMARNMNTVAGRGAQVLAYARQMGSVSEEEARRLQNGLMSGDRSLMDESLNRILVAQFGSADRGRTMINDSMYMNAMRQSMSDEAGAFAMKTMQRGADTEYMRQEQITAAEHRYTVSRTALAEAGLKTGQTADGVRNIVDSVAASLREIDGGGVYADSFKENVNALIGKGMKPEAALNSVVSSFKRSSVTGKFGETIDLAIKRQSTRNNEAVLKGPGALESRQAKEMTQELVSKRLIDGKQSGEIYKMIREGRGTDALAAVDRVVGGLSSANQTLFGEIKDEATRKHTAALNTLEDSASAEKLVSAAGQTGYGSQAVQESFTQAIAAARGYAKTGNYDDFWQSLKQSKLSSIFGKEGANLEDEILKMATSGDKKGLEKTLSRMGRVSVNLGQMATQNLQANGYDLNYAGYWGGGLYAGNSGRAEKARDNLIQKTVAAWNKDSEERAGDRTTFAQDLVGLLTGEKDWRALLKVHDRGSVLSDALSDYDKADADYQAAKEAYGKTQKGYDDVLKRLNKSGNGVVARRIEEFARDGSFSAENLEALQSELMAGGLDPDDLDTVMESMGSLKTLGEKQRASEKAMTDAVKKSGFGDAFRNFKVSLDRDAARKQKVAKDTQTLSFMDGLDLSEEGLDAATGKLKGAFDAMFKGVTREEVLQKAGAKDLSKQDYAETALALTKEKAANGDAAAVDVMKQFKAASNEGVTKIRGEIVLKSGNDQTPALLEGNMGGL